MDYEKSSSQRARLLHYDLYGARGGNRTRTLFRARDFKSLVSTSFTTRAGGIQNLEAPTGFEPVYKVLQTSA